MKKHLLDLTFIEEHYGERFHILSKNTTPVFEMYNPSSSMAKYICYDDGKVYSGRSTLATGQEPDEENPDAD